MRFVKNMFAASVLLALLSSFWSCSDDENTLSEAVLASSPTLNFEANGVAEMTLTIYADADWETEIPEWVAVTPESGSGTMDVTVSVLPNMRDGAPDNPRKATLVFKGRTLASRAEVLIVQDGDKYRDVKDYTIAEVVGLADDAIVSVPEAIVMAVTTKGFIASDPDNSGNIYIQNTTPVAVGDRISLRGSKATDSQSLAYMECDEVKVLSHGTATYPAATDITDKIDTYTAKTRDYIKVSGKLVGSTVTIEEAKYSVSITDAPESMGLAALNGHLVTVEGYFGGVAEPVIKLTASVVKDDGVAEIIYFSEDFEWLEPWALAGDNNGKPAGDTVKDDNLDAYAPQIPTPKVEGVSALDALEAKGYQFLRVTTKKEGECIYLQRNYLKFGKTSYQAGIVLPSIDGVPAGAKLTLSFDWCPMRQGSGKVDPVNLILIVKNGDNETTFDIPESGFENDHRLEWIRAEVPLSGITVTKDTEITLRQTQWPAATANRWFLDNIKLSEPK